MARLLSCGFELNSVTNGVEVRTSGNSPTINSSTFRSGAYALNMSDNKFVTFRYAASAVDGIYYTFRYYLYLTAYSSIDKLFSYDGTDAYIYLKPTGELEAQSETVIVGTSPVLNLNTWYRVEVKTRFTDNVGGIGDAEWRLNGVRFASLIGGFFAGDGITFTLGSSGVGTYSAIVDDIAINDDTGSFQNSWSGEGSIVHLRPSATGDNSAWTGTNTDIDEVTPDDVTTFISSLTSGDIEDVNIDDTPTALTSNLLIPVVQVGVRFNESVITDPDPTFVVRIKASASGTVEEGSTITASSTTWGTNSPASAVPANYTLTLYNLPGSSTIPYTKAELDSSQIGVRLTNSPVGLAQVSTLWLLVEYQARVSGKPHNYSRYMQVGGGTSRNELAK